MSGSQLERMSGCDEEWPGDVLEDLGGGAATEAEEGGVDATAAGGCTGSSCSKKRMRHINNERQRRILMNTLLDSLQSILPDPHPRKDRCALLTDAIAYVQLLESELQQLEVQSAKLKRSKSKLQLPASGATSGAPPQPPPERPFVAVNLRHMHVQLMTQPDDDDSMATSMAGAGGGSEEVIITFTTSPPLLHHVLHVCQQNLIDIIDVTLSTTPDDQKLYYIHARVRKEKGYQSDDLKLLFSQMTFQEDETTYSFII